MPIEILTESESNRLLEHLSSPRSPRCSPRNALRNRLLALLMLDAGLRVGEVVSLNISDVWIHNQPAKTVHVKAEIAKNKRSRYIPMTERLLTTLAPYFRGTIAPATILNLSWVFPGKNHLHHLATRHVHRIITRAGLASIGRAIHPHILRHTFASRLMRRTNTRVVQELLGHTSLSSTQIYTHPNSDDLVQAIKAI